MLAEELACLLPEDAATINQSLEFLEPDLERLLADLEQSPASEDGLRAITFVLTGEDENTIEKAVEPTRVRRTARAKSRCRRALPDGGRKSYHSDTRGTPNSRNL